jgi:septal ring factor EnvC (AmiA/AmiB activator)
MRYAPHIPRWNLHALLALRPARAHALPVILGVCALAGWGAFASRASGQRDLAAQVRVLQADRDTLVGRQKLLEQANTELVRDWQGKLASLRDELGQSTAARDAAKAQLASAQRELTGVKKRLDQARDRVSETGSIKAAEASKKGASKP